MVPFYLPTIRVLAITLVLGLTGCTRTVYELQLTPSGETMRRELVVSQEPKPAKGDDATSPLSDDELAHMREFYDQALERVESGTHLFAGDFQAEMPADVGGAGRYLFLDSPLGSSSLYSERFRGEDDLQKLIQSRDEAIDHLVDLLINWSREEFAGQPVQVRLEALLDQDIRRDLKNLSIYCWAIRMGDDQGGGDDEMAQQFAARVGMYLIERDYFSLAELPRILHIARSEDQPMAGSLIKDTLIRKLKISDDEPAVASLAILDDPNRLASSLRASIRKTEIYRAEFEQHKKSRKLAGRVTKTDLEFDPLGLLSKYAFQAMVPNLFADTHVRVQLNCDVKPYATNAEWDERENSLDWNDHISDDNIPAMMFAAWSLPNADFQKQRFGETILEGEPLACFVYWYRGLAEDQRQQYDEFLSTLAPGSELVDKLDEFRFVDNEKLAELPRSLFKHAIEKAR